MTGFMTKEEAARKRREEMLAILQRVVDLCTCLWPDVKYRNGDGHDPQCPAHRPIGASRDKFPPTLDGAGYVVPRPEAE